MNGIKFRIMALNLLVPVVLIAALWLAFALSMIRVERLSSSALDSTLRDSFDSLAKQEVDVAVTLLQGVHDLEQKGSLKPDEARTLGATLLRGLRFGSDGYFFADDLHGTNVVLLGREVEGKNRDNFQDAKGLYVIKEMRKVAQNGGGFVDFWFPRKGGGEALPKRDYVALFEPYGWVLGTGNYIDDIDIKVANSDAAFRAVTNRTHYSILLVVVAGLLVAAALAFILSGRMAKPIVDLVSKAKRISAGELDVKIDTKAKGEVGELAEALRTMVKTLEERAYWYESMLDAISTPISVTDLDRRWTFINRAAERLTGHKRAEVLGQPCSKWASDICNTEKCGIECLSRGQNTSSFSDARSKKDFQINSFYLLDKRGERIGHIEVVRDVTETNSMKRKAEEALKRGMIEAAQSIEGVVERVTAAAEELSAQVEQISKGTGLQATRAAETATAMEQMNATVLDVARNAGDAATNAEEAKKEADSGSRLMNQAFEAIAAVEHQTGNVKQGMDDLGHQVESIGKVMNVINDIADQTNLLALNAAIEAARAGDAGRGFAVVADEVRKLAEKTMSATKEVGESINSIQEAARRSIGEMESAATAVSRATELSRQTGDSLQRIVHNVEANYDQAQSIAAAAEEQSSTSDEISRAVEEVNRISAETATGMSQSAGAISELASMAEQLRGVVAHLKQG